MATCYDCIHCDACSDAGDGGFSCLKEDVTKCKHFKNKADFVEVVRCKDCKHYDMNHHICLLSSAMFVTYMDRFCWYGERMEDK